MAITGVKLLHGIGWSLPQLLHMVIKQVAYPAESSLGKGGEAQGTYDSVGPLYAQVIVEGLECHLDIVVGETPLNAAGIAYWLAQMVFFDATAAGQGHHTCQDIGAAGQMGHLHTPVTLKCADNCPELTFPDDNRRVVGQVALFIVVDGALAGRVCGGGGGAAGEIARGSTGGES